MKLIGNEATTDRPPMLANTHVRPRNAADRAGLEGVVAEREGDLLVVVFPCGGWAAHDRPVR